MYKIPFIILLSALLICVDDVQANEAVVVDSITRLPLLNAAVFDRNGRTIGVCKSDGRLPRMSWLDYPVTVRYMGYKECVVPDIYTDTVFMVESTLELPEVVIASRQHKLLHMLAYVREYSMLTTYRDTVFMFREKMVDFMLSPEPEKIRGWSSPRVMQSRSYYRFTNNQGLDSVSDRCSHHFSWSDWIGIVPRTAMPAKLRGDAVGCDTLRGKYSPTEIWVKNDDRVTVDVNVLADTASRKWVPNLSLFFRDNIDFEQFRLRLNYRNVGDDEISPLDLTGYSFSMESNGRGHGMFRFNRYDEPFFVSTYGEVYILDKEFVTAKEARKWEKLQSDAGAIAMYESSDAPELQPSIRQLVDRVNKLDHDRVRLDFVPDRRLVGRGVVKQNIGQRMLQMLKTVTGISSIKARKSMKRQWKDFTRDRAKRNQDLPQQE